MADSPQNRCLEQSNGRAAQTWERDQEGHLCRSTGATTWRMTTCPDLTAENKMTADSTAVTRAGKPAESHAKHVQQHKNLQLDSRACTDIHSVQAMCDAHAMTLHTSFTTNREPSCAGLHVRHGDVNCANRELILKFKHRLFSRADVWCCCCMLVSSWQPEHLICCSKHQAWRASTKHACEKTSALQHTMQHTNLP